MSQGVHHGLVSVVVVASTNHGSREIKFILVLDEWVIRLDVCALVD